MNVGCSAIPCPVILDSTCVFYSGANLIYTGINTNDSLEQALIKIDNKFKDAGLGYVFQNGIIQAVPGGPVKLGGALIEPTTIANFGYPLTVSNILNAGAHVTIGGTSSDFVKGDGSLDNTTYQVAGNYITALTGDGTATGPGSVPFTLATTGVLANTYGSSTDIPIITVDTKGRITLATSVPFVAPPALLIFSGDVTGAGYTNTTIPLTLAPVLSTPGTYGSTTSIPVVTVNAKGLVTNISQVSLPTSLGTVTSVGVSAGTGISASVANPTTTPVITITNTAPDQTVVLNNGTGISVTGTYPSFTITNTGITSVPTLQQVTGVGNETTFSLTSFSTQGFQVKTPVNQTLSSLQSNLGQTEGEIFIGDILGNSTIYKRTEITAGTNSLSFPNATGTFALSVNGNTADSFGAITIPVGTGTVTAVTATSPITSSGGTAPDISTSMATNKLIGRSSAGVGVMEEITVGTGLSLSGGTLNATAQSVGFEQNFLLMGA